MSKIQEAGTFKGRPFDVVVAVMGPSGAGKSTFINNIAGQTVAEVGHGLHSQTSELTPVVIPYGRGGFANPRGANGRLVLVDTPGFDDTYIEDVEILRRISIWLADTYASKKLDGIIYLHDITQSRVVGETHRNPVKMLQELVGSSELKSVILGTMKWGLLPIPGSGLDGNIGDERQNQLESDYWEDMIVAGAKVFRVENATICFQMVNEILQVLSANKNSGNGLEKVNSKASKTAKELEKDAKFVEVIREKSDLVFNGNPSDVIIPIMGPTGVGKSTLINNILGQRKVKIGHGLQSETAQLNPIVIPYGRSGFTDPYGGKGGGRLVLVDTPGFDNTYVDDVEILRRVSVWLADSYTKNMKLGGVIYLHDITLKRMFGTTRRNLDMFKKLVGQEALSSVVLGTTNWNLVPPEIGANHQKQLESEFWKEMIEAGSKIVKLDTSDASRPIIEGILQRLTDPNILAGEYLQIQHEIANLHRYIPETEAGKTLKYTLKELAEVQEKRVQRLKEQLLKTSDNPDLVEEFQKGQEELAIILASAKQLNLKVPFTKRLIRLFL